MQIEEERVFHFELQTIYRKSSDNFFSIPCGPQNLIQSVNVLAKVIFTVSWAKQHLLGEKWEGRWHTERSHQGNDGLEQSVQKHSKQSSSYLKFAGMFLAMQNVISQKTGRWGRGWIEPQKAWKYIYVSMYAYKTIAPVLELTWPAKPLLSFSVSF